MKILIEKFQSKIYFNSGYSEDQRFDCAGGKAEETSEFDVAHLAHVLRQQSESLQSRCTFMVTQRVEVGVIFRHFVALDGRVSLRD